MLNKTYFRIEKRVKQNSSLVHSVLHSWHGGFLNLPRWTRSTWQRQVAAIPFAAWASGGGIVARILVNFMSPKTLYLAFNRRRVCSYEMVDTLCCVSCRVLGLRGLLAEICFSMFVHRRINYKNLSGTRFEGF